MEYVTDDATQVVRWQTDGRTDRRTD